MTRVPFHALKTLFTLSLSILAALFTLGLTSQAFAQSTDKGFITAKTWIDPANGHAAAGNGTTDDTQNMQDMVNYAIANHASIQLEPGTYKISKTLMIQNPPQGFHFGFRMSGIGGPNDTNTTWNNSGVSISLVTSDPTQLAIVEVGAGSFYDMTFENIGLCTSTNGQPSAVPVKYGLLFAGQNFSHVKIDMVTVTTVNTAFAIDVVPGINQGGNGEAVNISNCRCDSCNCFYLNNSPAGQALAHSISRCEFGIKNGGSAIRMMRDGLGIDITSFSGTFQAGPLRNTLIECDGFPAYVNYTGGRVEICDTVIWYAGGSTICRGCVTVRGMDFGGFGWGGATYGLIDDTLGGGGAQQYTNTLEECRFTGDSATALSIAHSSLWDASKNYFDRCTFMDFTNNLTDASNQADLKRIGAVVRDCRSATDLQGNLMFTNMSFP